MKTVKISIFTVLAIATLGMMSCKKGCTDEKATNYYDKAKRDDGTCTYTSSLEIQIDHSVDGEVITWNEKNYTNAAGNLYSIETLKYYVSDVVLHGASGTSDYSTELVHYRDASDEGTREFMIMDIPVGSYEKISFTFGLDEVDNIAGGLENTSINGNMEWPAAMGVVDITI